MNRRSLFKLLAGAATACALEWGGVAQKVAELPKKLRVIVNPAYVAAKYEDVVIWNPKVLQRLGLSEPPVVDPPKRYNNEDGKWVEVPFYKEIPDEI